MAAAVRSNRFPSQYCHLPGGSVPPFLPLLRDRSLDGHPPPEPVGLRLHLQLDRTHRRRPAVRKGYRLHPSNRLKRVELQSSERANHNNRFGDPPSKERPRTQLDRRVSLLHAPAQGPSAQAARQEALWLRGLHRQPKVPSEGGTPHPLPDRLFEDPTAASQ